MVTSAPSTSLYLCDISNDSWSEQWRLTRRQVLASPPSRRVSTQKASVHNGGHDSVVRIFLHLAEVYYIGLHRTIFPLTTVLQLYLWESLIIHWQHWLEWCHKTIYGNMVTCICISLQKRSRRDDPLKSFTYDPEGSRPIKKVHSLSHTTSSAVVVISEPI